ncbi:MAG: nucleotidyltransferase domain-containing protein [Candidatus Anstonellales archaeon]
MRYFDILVERRKQKEDTLNKLEKYLNIIKNFLQQKYEFFKIIIFGSYVRKKILPNSDIDVLIVLPQIDNIEQKHHLNYEIRKLIDFNPFIEIHITTQEEFSSWWSKFIKNDYIEF